MALTVYTTYDAIRAILGVSPKEVKDGVMDAPIFEQQFLLEMGDVDSGGGVVMAQYASISALAESSRSADQQRLYDITNMLAAYSVARQLLTGIELAAPFRITDGKAAVERFRTADFDKVRAGVLDTYATLLRRLKATVIKLVPTAQIAVTPARIFIGSAPIGTDPITGV